MPQEKIITKIEHKTNQEIIDGLATTITINKKNQNLSEKITNKINDLKKDQHKNKVKKIKKQLENKTYQQPSNKILAGKIIKDIDVLNFLTKKL
jgi:hypothetical protein